VLQAVQFPAGIADLDSGLADVDGDALTLKHTSRENGYTLHWSISSFNCMLHLPIHCTTTDFSRVQDTSLFLTGSCY
jgi:hypothetical protein